MELGKNAMKWLKWDWNSTYLRNTGFAEVNEEKSLKYFVSIKTLKKLKTELLGNFMP